MNHSEIRSRRQPSPEKIRKLRVNMINGVLLLILSISGLVLISSHGGRHGADAAFWGMERGMWRTLHIATAFAYLPFFSWHLFLQRKWLKAQFSRFFSMGKGRVLASRLTLGIGAIVLLTGFIGYFFNEAGMMTGRIFVEIHDKFGIIMIGFMFVHLHYTVVKPHRKVLASQVD